MTLLVVGLGGALGAISRYLATDWIRQWLGDAFPWGTMAVNMLGSFALGFVFVWLQSIAPSTQLRQFVAIGFLGSFTTFSTFSYETVALARAGEMWRAGFVLRIQPLPNLYEGYGWRLLEFLYTEHLMVSGPL